MSNSLSTLNNWISKVTKVSQINVVEEKKIEVWAENVIIQLQ